MNTASRNDDECLGRKKQIAIAVFANGDSTQSSSIEKPAAPHAMKTRALLLGCVAALAFSTSARSMIVSYAYDSAGRLTKANYGGASNTTYAYDNNGNLLARK